MTEMEACQNIETKSIETSLFPINQKQIDVFFNQEKYKNIPMYGFKNILSGKINQIEDSNPDLYEEIIGNSEYFRKKYLKETGLINYFPTGSCLMYEIFSHQSAIKNIEVPIFDVGDFKSTDTARPTSALRNIDLKKYAFLGRVNHETPHHEKVKRNMFMRDIILFDSEQQELLDRLYIPDNPSLFVGAAFVYSRFRKKMIANDIVQ